MEARESSLSNAEMVDEPSSFEQELRNYDVENMPDFTGVPIPAKPLNIYLGDNLVKQIKDSLKDQIHKYNKDLNKLESEENPEQATVLHKGKKRGRKAVNATVGPICATFELPKVCSQNNIDIETVLAIRDPECPRKFSILERAQNWTIQYRRRTNPKMKDYSFDHLPSSKKFRSQKKMINYILYEDGEYGEEKTNKKKKKKQDVVAIHNNENLGSTSSASRNEMTSDDPMVKENEKEEEIESETDEEFSKITSDQVVENKMTTTDSNEGGGKVQKV